MSMPREKHESCRVCGQPRSPRRLLHADLIHGPVLEQIRGSVPTLSEQDAVCLDCLNHYRAEYVARVLEEERGELSALEKGVVESLEEHELVATDPELAFERQWTLGERVADHVASFGGSWWFLSLFALVLLTWVAINSFSLQRHPFDPYPYILLNLVLSCLAAVQAPVIMMSQNRQEAKDRLRAQHDYRVNLKAELEVRQLHWKIDQLLNHQWRRLLEIQQIQTDLMRELAGTTRPRQPS